MVHVRNSRDEADLLSDAFAVASEEPAYDAVAHLKAATETVPQGVDVEEM